MAWKIEPGMKLEAFTEDHFSGWWAIRDSISGVEIGSGDGGFEKQDARLFAEAPNMLELLKNFVMHSECGNHDPDMVDIAKCLIERVEKE